MTTLVTLETLAQRRGVLGPSTCSDTVDQAFRDDPQLRSVLVRRPDGSVEVLNRAAFFQSLVGPLGFGLALYKSRPVLDLIDWRSTPWSAAAGAAEVALALIAGVATDDRDLLVRYDNGGFGTVGVADVFAALATDYDRQLEVVAQSDRRLRALLKSSTEVVALVDEDGSIRWMSASAKSVLGVDPDSRVGQSAFERVHPEDVAHLRRLVTDSVERPFDRFTGEVRLYTELTGWRMFELNTRNRIDDPAVGAIVLNFRDVTEQRKLEDELRHQATHDHLTALPNRLLFADRVAAALASPHQLAIGVAFIDLDGFKATNDTLGHTVGDALLCSVARRLESVLREGDLVARWAAMSSRC